MIATSEVVTRLLLALETVSFVPVVNVQICAFRSLLRKGRCVST